MSDVDNPLNVTGPVNVDKRGGDEAAEEEQDKNTFEIDELDIMDRNSDDIDINHCRIKKISKLETIPNV